MHYARYFDFANNANRQQGNQQMSCVFVQPQQPNQRQQRQRNQNNALA